MHPGALTSNFCLKVDIEGNSEKFREKLQNYPLLPNFKTTNSNFHQNFPIFQKIFKIQRSLLVCAVFIEKDDSENKAAKVPKKLQKKISEMRP